MFEFVLLKNRNSASFFNHILKNPLVFGSGVGIGIGIVGGLDNAVGDLLSNPLQMIALTASPLALLALGGFIHGLKWRSMSISILITSTFVKLLVLPVLAYYAFMIAGSEDVVRNSGVLMAGMPVAVTAFVLADEYKLNKENVALAIMLSTIIAPVTI